MSSAYAQRMLLFIDSQPQKPFVISMKKVVVFSILFMVSYIRKLLYEIWHLYVFTVHKIYIKLKRDEIAAAAAAVASLKIHFNSMIT